MTNKDIYDVLYDTRLVVDRMSKEKIKQILEILMSIQRKHRCVFFNSADLVKYTKKLLTSFMKCNNLVAVFNRKKMRRLYTILADYLVYPICQLCGKPIKQYSNNKHPMEFSWDHKIPKSLGGPSELYNLQPTHKLCNNRKGNDTLFAIHYEIDVVVGANGNVNVTEQTKQYRQYNLHKNRYWKQCRNDFCRQM